MEPGEVTHLVSCGNGTHIVMVCCERCHKNSNEVWEAGNRYRPICHVCAEETGEPALVGPIPERRMLVEQ